MEIREAQIQDLDGLLMLYSHLHGEVPPERTAALEAQWRGMAADANHHVLLGFEGGSLVGSCVLLVVPNLSRGARPYGLVENVITHPQHRRQGVGSALLAHVQALAKAAGCYKIMLMTSRRDESTLRFYCKAGYNCQDKTAFLMQL